MEIKNLTGLQYVFSVSNEVRDICKPLFDNTDIVLFQTARAFGSGAYFWLTTHPEFLKFICENPMPIPSKRVKGKALLENGWYLLDEVPDAIFPKELLPFTREKMNLDNFILKVDHKDAFCDFYVFATEANSPFDTNFYFNNIDLLEHFIKFFEKKSCHLYEVQKDCKKRLVLHSDELPGQNEHSVCDREKRRTFIKYVVDNSNLVKDGKEIPLTSREKGCLMHLSKGKSIKETAGILEISPRTVSVHFKNIKDKLNCYSKSAIIELFRSQPFYDEGI